MEWPFFFKKQSNYMESDAYKYFSRLNVNLKWCPRLWYTLSQGYMNLWFVTWSCIISSCSDIIVIVFCYKWFFTTSLNCGWRNISHDWIHLTRFTYKVFFDSALFHIMSQSELINVLLRYSALEGEGIVANAKFITRILHKGIFTGFF